MVVSKLKALVPAAAEPTVIKTWYTLRPLVQLLFFGRQRYCCVCDSSSRFFLSQGPASRRRKDIICPVCLSHDRHRLAWLYLSSRTNLTDTTPKKMLHFAPETIFAEKFKRIPGVDYLSADLNSPHAMVKMDITDIQWPDSSFDIIYCSHVLEHVPDDHKAMREIFRTLKPGGWALIQVPISKENTIEDLSITDPAERERLYWQDDHVRLYGLDIKERLARAGFDVEVIFGGQLVESEEMELMRFDPGEPLFYCKKTIAPSRLERLSALSSKTS